MPADSWSDLNRRWPLGSVGAVSELYGGIDQLQAILDVAAADRQIVVLKFKREGCPACGATIERLEALAANNEERIRVFTVDFDSCRAFCKECRIKAVPCAHIYQDDVLVEALPMGPASYDAFAARLAAVMADLASSSPLSERPVERDAAKEAGEHRWLANIIAVPHRLIRLLDFDSYSHRA